ncbi:MAG: hypothetical protein FJ276_32215 [Planctomycetes bacterium]|nr:hypothetical protein [Planctomycetota bacterium]
MTLTHDMPFGKYMARPIAEVLVSYLRWLLTMDLTNTRRAGQRRTNGADPHDATLDSAMV